MDTVNGILCSVSFFLITEIQYPFKVSIDTFQHYGLTVNAELTSDVIPFFLSWLTVLPKR